MLSILKEKDSKNDNLDDLHGTCRNFNFESIKNSLNLKNNDSSQIQSARDPNK